MHNCTCSVHSDVTLASPPPLEQLYSHLRSKSAELLTHKKALVATFSSITAFIKIRKPAPAQDNAENNFKEGGRGRTNILFNFVIFFLGEKRPHFEFIIYNLFKG